MSSNQTIDEWREWSEIITESHSRLVRAVANGGTKKTIVFTCMSVAETLHDLIVDINRAVPEKGETEDE
jgi:hypothetical protein